MQSSARAPVIFDPPVINGNYNQFPPSYVGSLAGTVSGPVNRPLWSMPMANDEEYEVGTAQSVPGIQRLSAIYKCNGSGCEPRCGDLAIIWKYNKNERASYPIHIGNRYLAGKGGEPDIIVAFAGYDMDWNSYTGLGLDDTQGAKHTFVGVFPLASSFRLQNSPDKKWSFDEIAIEVGWCRDVLAPPTSGPRSAYSTKPKMAAGEKIYARFDVNDPRSLVIDCVSSGPRAHWETCLGTLQLIGSLDQKVPLKVNK